MANDYPAWLTLQPIQQWPRELTANRVPSPFRAAWGSTTTLLKTELRHLGVDVARGDRGRADVVLQIAITKDDLKLRGDGLYAGRHPVHPGVVLAIESKHGPLSYACDRFTTWRDNLRAIALALEALRKVDRYGIGETGQQYTGWQQLPAGGSTPAQSMTADDAERVLRANAPDQPRSVLTLEAAHRAARANAHPDRNNGDRHAWDAVEAAADTLRAAGRLS